MKITIFVADLCFTSVKLEKGINGINVIKNESLITILPCDSLHYIKVGKNGEKIYDYIF